MVCFGQPPVDRSEQRLDCGVILRSHIQGLSLRHIYKNKAGLRVKFQNDLVFSGNIISMQLSHIKRQYVRPSASHVSQRSVTYKSTRLCFTLLVNVAEVQRASRGRSATAECVIGMRSLLLCF